MIGTDLVLPSTGELVDLTDANQVAQALENLRQLEQQIRDAKAELTQALIEHSQTFGSKTIPLTGGRSAVIKSGPETVYDAQEIMDGLRAAGMPEARIAEIVQETVTYSVRAVEAKRAAAANLTYADVIDRFSHTVEKRPSVTIRARNLVQ